MGMFNVREPRRFEHKYIYYDERKEKLAKFVEGTTHLKRRKENGGPQLSFPVAIVLIVLLTLLLLYFLNGDSFLFR